MTSPNLHSPTESDQAPPRRSWVKRTIAWLVVVALAAGVAFLWVERDKAAAEADAAPPKKKRRSRGAKVTPVTAIAPEQRLFVATSTFRGELDADTADIGATMAGRLDAVSVRLGDKVAANALLATIDSQTMRAQRDALVAAVEGSRAAVRGANVASAAARTERKRMVKLAEQGATSQQTADAARATASALAAEVRVARAALATAIANLEAADQGLGEAMIYAPFAGVVTARMQDVGDYVQKGTPIVRLVQAGELRVRFDVPEQHIASITPGLKVQVRAAATGKREVEAVVRGVAAEVDRERRVLEVEATLADMPPSWVSGMYAEVVVPRLKLPDATVVPEPSVLSRRIADGSNEDGIFVVDGDKATWVRVRVLAREDGHAAVEPADAALDSTSRVLVSGHSDLADGAAISAAKGDK